jgi:enamine deaminase RidA (YjgF/YER057c/UK114 family)
MSKITRVNVGKRLSDMAVHNGVAYLAGQVADDTTQDITGQTTQILAVKQVVLRSDTSRLKPWAQKVLASDNPAELMASA